MVSSVHRSASPEKTMALSAPLDRVERRKKLTYPQSAPRLSIWLLVISISLYFAWAGSAQTPSEMKTRFKLGTFVARLTFASGFPVLISAMLGLSPSLSLLQ